MSELMLCKRPIAAVPYYIDEASLNIYSLEELSYYIYNNSLSINSDFVSSDLCNWIGRELEYKELEHKLLEFIAEDVPASVFVSHLLREVAYLTDSEIKSVIDTVAKFENKSEAERRKYKADKLLDSDKIVDAIFAYENMLINCTSKSFTKELQGDIYHNLGVCYARLFFFMEAAECFDMAYRLNRKRDSLESLLTAYRCCKNEEGFKAAATKYYVPDEMCQRIIKVVSDTAAGSEVRDFHENIRNLKVNTMSLDEYQDKLNVIISKWQSDYCSLC